MAVSYLVSTTMLKKIRKYDFKENIPEITVPVILELKFLTYSLNVADVLTL
jgi:hypothetical protein